MEGGGKVPRIEETDLTDAKECMSPMEDCVKCSDGSVTVFSSAT